MFKKSRRITHTSALLCAIVLITTSLSTNADIFVSNDGSNTVTVYANSATGNQAPLRQFSVRGTPRGIYVDTLNSEIFVATQGGDIYVYDINASGAAVAKRNITTGMDFQGIHVDTVNNEIFVADRCCSGIGIRVYSRTANGAAAPLRTITISGNEPRGVAVDAAAGELYVSVSNKVLTFARTASGAAVPLRTITPPTGTFFSDMSQLTFDAASAELVVANHGRDAIRVWPRAANGAVSPTRSIIGASTLLDSPRGVAVCGGSSEYVATARNQDRISVHAANANGDVAPLRTIEGAATLLSSPRFVAVTGGSCATGPATPVPSLGASGLLTLTALIGLFGICTLAWRRRKALFL